MAAIYLVCFCHVDLALKASGWGDDVIWRLIAQR